jgi:enterochelin esterase family protein
MPVTIGLFITPGHRAETYPANLGTGNPNNRAQEYDAVNDNYARFLVDEMIPELKKKYNITDNPEGRVIGGTSSGAICAFTVAWFKPDQFRKVISMIGSYVSIGYRPARDGQPAVSGGEIYPTWIRREQPKPIRIFLQDGANDLANSQPTAPFTDGTTLSNQFGSWFLANQQMLSAFQYANRVARGTTRYDVNHVWGDGNHSDLHGGVLLPDILRWMFRDWPKE